MHQYLTITVDKFKFKTLSIKLPLHSNALSISSMWGYQNSMCFCVQSNHNFSVESPNLYYDSWS